ncbi:MAG: hypothetical protein WC073_12870 [Sterolibacterium sp.]
MALLAAGGAGAENESKKIFTNAARIWKLVKDFTILGAQSGDIHQKKRTGIEVNEDCHAGPSGMRYQVKIFLP